MIRVAEPFGLDRVDVLAIPVLETRFTEFIAAPLVLGSFALRPVSLFYCCAVYDIYKAISITTRLGLYIK